MKAMKTTMIKLAVLSLLTMLMMSRCIDEKVDPPVADFYFTGDNVPAPCTIQFINTSENADTYLWTFGDGETSTEESPTHYYAQGGTYVVILKAEGNGGKDVATKNLIIQAPAPVADFSYVVSGYSVAFTNLSSNATSYLWSFGDEGTSTTSSPTHQYSSYGTYTVTLVAYGGGTSDTETKTVVIQSSGTTTDVTFNNPVFTDIYITINNDTRVIEPEGSVTFYGIPGNSFTYSAYTSGKTTTGTQVGLLMTWNNTINISGGTASYNLVINNTVFFLYMRNYGTHTLTPLYVNYGLSNQSMDNIVIPNNNTTYRIGYYRAYTSTQVRAYWQDQTSYYTYWNQGTHFNLPWTQNQYVTLLNNIKGNSDSDNVPQAILSPERLFSVDDQPVIRKKFLDAVDLYCK
jgi:PKD repeat protein